MAGKNDVVSGTEVQLSNSEPLQSLKLFSECYPSFIVFVKREESDNIIQKLPYNFILECGTDLIPKTIILQMPNGHEIHANYNKSEQCISNLSGFVKKCKGLFSSLIVYSYKGNGIFSVHFFKSDLCEVDYCQSRTIPRAPVLVQDNITGIGWKFMVIVNDHVIETGDIPIPCSFWRRFGKLLPEKVRIVLRNCALFDGFFSQLERKMLGFQNLTGSDIIKNHRTLLLSYFGGGKFEVLIFDKSDVENCLHEDTDSSDSSDSEDSDGSEGDGTDADAELEDVEDVQHINNMDGQFAVIMNRSNVDNSSHGVYIPRDINPSNREWREGEEVLLRTETGEWFVGLVFSNGSARFSAGWNKFIRENEVKLNQTLLFNLLEDEEGGCVFDTEVVGNN